MKLELKSLILGISLCIAGAILIDCDIVITGITTLIMGAIICMFGPIACDLFK